LLFLVHRIPFPPNKGDKIRSYHILKYLAKSYDVFLGTFIDDEEDWQYEGQINSLCKETFIRGLKPFSSKIKSLSGFVTNQPLTLPYYYDDTLQKWVEAVVEKHNIQKMVVFSSSMAQYIDHPRYKNKTRVIDFVDVDSEKWRQYSAKKTWPESYVYKREAKRLLEYEKSVASTFNASLFVSDDEARCFSDLMGVTSAKIDYFFNGVDTHYFKPDEAHISPYQEGEKVIVFTGAMDYWANEDAVTWFAQEVFPDVRDKYNLKFYIVGSNPTNAVKNLAGIDGVTVTGRVADIRPYLAFAFIAVAPLRIARGIQNKVLEAMAMESCVIASSSAVEGIKAQGGNLILIADSKSDYLQQITLLIEQAQQIKSIGQAARSFVVRQFGWDNNLARLGLFLNNEDTTVHNDLACQVEAKVEALIDAQVETKAGKHS